MTIISVHSIHLYWTNSTFLVLENFLLFKTWRTNWVCRKYFCNYPKCDWPSFEKHFSQNNFAVVFTTLITLSFNRNKFIIKFQLSCIFSSIQAYDSILGSCILYFMYSCLTWHHAWWIDFCHAMPENDEIMLKLAMNLRKIKRILLKNRSMDTLWTRL